MKSPCFFTLLGITLTFFGTNAFAVTFDNIYFSASGMPTSGGLESTSGVYSVNKDGLNLQTIIPGFQSDSIGVDLSKIYVTSDLYHSLTSFNLDGSGEQILLDGSNGGANQALRFELDPNTNRIFFIGSVNGESGIGKVSTNGLGAERILANVGSNERIALDHTAQKVYFSNNQQHAIERIGYDGNNLETVLQFDSTVTIDTIRVDPLTQKIYFSIRQPDVVSGTSYAIGRSGINGDQIENLILGSIARDFLFDSANGVFYFGSPFSPLGTGIIEANLSGGNLQRIFSNNIPTDIDVRALAFGPYSTSNPGATTSIPEPSTFFLIGTGLIGLLVKHEEHAGHAAGARHLSTKKGTGYRGDTLKDEARNIKNIDSERQP